MIIYYRENSRVGPRIQQVVEEVYPRELTTVFNSIKDAIAFPAFSPACHNIILLTAEDKRELAGFSFYLPQLLERKILLILPDMEFETLSIGCMYHPRYMADMKGDLNDLQKVISNMTNKISPYSHK